MGEIIHEIGIEYPDVRDCFESHSRDRDMKWNWEEYIELMTFGKVERQMFVELFGPLVGLDREWLAQGASQEEVEMVFGLDHRVPNGTPLENYRYYVDLGRELLGLPPRSPERKGWARMASVMNKFTLQV